MAEVMTYAECEDMVDRHTKLPESIPEMLLTLISEDELPNYMRGMRMLNLGLALVGEVLEPCSPDCNDPACAGTPTHQKVAHECLDVEYGSAQSAVKMLRDAMVMFVFKSVNCDCYGCQDKRKRNVAPFN